MRSLLIAAVTVCVVLSGCCGNEGSYESASPDGQWKYVSFERNCGATTSNNLQISVLPASKRLANGAGNAFIADYNHEATSFTPKAEWLSARRLQITYSAKGRVFKKELKVGPIDISYVELNNR